MRTLLLTTMLLAMFSGCVIHEPSYQIIYTPEHPLTNSQAAGVQSPSPGTSSTAQAMAEVSVTQQLSR